MLKIQNVSKIYNMKGNEKIYALNNISLELPSKGMVFLLGKSGSGKTTMLNLIGGLDEATDGEIIVDGTSMKDFNAQKYDAYRNTYIGFVFQEYNLIEEFNVYQNIAFALELQGEKVKEEVIKSVLTMVEMEGCECRKISELSGGQKQRVAIARALIKNPRIILADEPTGSLDTVTGAQIFEILKKLSKEKLVIVVSHDSDFAEKYGDRIVKLSDGKVSSDTGSMENETKQIMELKRSKMSFKTTLRIGMSFIKHKKIRFAVVVIVSLVSFLMVGVLDTFNSYKWKTALVDTLCDIDSTYVTAQKEKNIASGKKSKWYNDGFQLSMEDVDCLSERTGHLFKGVYNPALTELNIEQNYANTLLGNTQYATYATKFSGFVEFTEKDLCSFGYQLVAGRLPNGTKNEIAISKYMYDSFVLAGYREYMGPEIEIINSKEEVERIYCWEEILANPNIVSVENGRWAKLNNLITYDIKTYDDLIGRTLFVGGINYIITGIVDTGFNGEAYRNVSSMSRESEKDLLQSIKAKRLENEREYGVICLAFVGKGKITEIASVYPEVIKTDKMTFTANNEIFSFSTNFVAKFSDINLNKHKVLWPNRHIIEGENPSKDRWYHGDVCMTLQDTEMILPIVLLAEENIEQTDGEYWITPNYNIMWEDNREAYDVTVTYEDGHTAYGGKSWKVVGCIWDVNSYDDYFGLKDTVLVSDSFFDIISEGRAGIYDFAITDAPHTKKEMKQLITGCYEEKENLRYPIIGVAVSELNMLDELIRRFIAVFVYIAIGLVIFVIMIFSNFITASITQKKKEIGVMRALGARGKDVFNIFSCESFFMAAIIFTMSSIVTFAVVEMGNTILKNQFGIIVSIFHFSGRQVLLLMALSFFVAIVASFLPICNIAAKKPIDSIRGE